MVRLDCAFKTFRNEGFFGMYKGMQAVHIYACAFVHLYLSVFLVRLYVGTVSYVDCLCLCGFMYMHVHDFLGSINFLSHVYLKYVKRRCQCFYMLVEVYIIMNY